MGLLVAASAGAQQKPAQEMSGGASPAPVTVTLNFQLIEASNSGLRDPALAGLDSTLRSVLRFSGYRLLTTSVLNLSAGSMSQQTLRADGENYRLACSIRNAAAESRDGRVYLDVTLERFVPVAVVDGHAAETPVFSTGVDIPVGNTVVLGSFVEDHPHTVKASRMVTGDTLVKVGAEAVPSARGDYALILTVRPQIAGVRR